jgi:hypothetical protein
LRYCNKIPDEGYFIKKKRGLFWLTILEAKSPRSGSPMDAASVKGLKADGFMVGAHRRREKTKGQSCSFHNSLYRTDQGTQRELS